MKWHVRGFTKDWEVWTRFIVLVLSLCSAAVAQQVCVDKPQRPLDKSLEKDAALLDVNNIDCWIQNDGSVGENPATGRDGFYFPAGQEQNSIIYTGGIWILAGVNGEIRSAVNCYGSEFQPGAILPSGQPDDPEASKYKIYKYNRGEAVDAEAVAQGCPDELLGDQMLFYVINDVKSHEGMWGSQPLGVEVQATAFAFNQTGALGNTVFLKYRIVNKGTHPLDSAYVALYLDPDLGQANDDYAGTDTSLGIIFVYNGDGYDENHYGVEVPALACDFFQGPIVPAPGENVRLPDGTILPGQKILPMTASFFYI